MDKFKLLEKHAKHFVGISEDEKRKAITGIMYSLEGVAYVTDSHKALRIEGVSDGKEGKVFSLTGKDLEAEPFKMERLFPSRSNILAEDVHTQDLYDALNAFLAVIKIANNPSHCTLEATNEGLVLSLKQASFLGPTGVTGSWKIDGKVLTPFKKNFAIQLLFDCVKVMKDYGSFTHLVGDSNQFRPLLFSVGEVETLALPVRTY